MHRRITKIEPLADYVLKATFADGQVRFYDAKALPSRWEAFADLLVIGQLFEQVRLDTGGYGISWNDELDLDAEEVWAGGVPALY